MARNKNRGQRDTSDIANDPLELLTPSEPWPVFPTFGTTSRLSEVDDGREFDPGRRVSAARSLSGGAARVVDRSPVVRSFDNKPRLSHGHLQFDAPRDVVVCVRRRRRREVLHAKRRLNGRGARRRSEWSNVFCSR